MNAKKISTLALASVFGLGLAGNAHAAYVDVVGDIAVSTTWTKDNVYNLTEQIYVLPGASLTIEAGTVIATSPDPLENGSGSLAVTPGAQIFVLGTADEPVIMTSTNDVATWTGSSVVADEVVTLGDPKTGTWREAVNEWGNLTILGRGLISGSHFKGAPVVIDIDDDQVAGGSVTSRQNTAVPDGLNKRVMEGLVAEFPGDARILYGGDDDNDDSGTINFLSLRYTGRVEGLGNELNGMSLGGIGRGTEISHVDLMNNVDDGIEIWGGTVNLKYVNIWNIGDDSFDIDQGWRGKAQFGLIVQGFGADAPSGSGVGDNIFETDGAEDSDAQPVTTAVIYNFTAIGQPLGGDHATAWRDGARMQYRNCIFMDVGRNVVNNDGDDGDGAQGYGFNGTLSFNDVWTTDYDVTSPVNAGTFTLGAFNDPAVLYTAQTSGKLAEISDSVFFRNLGGNNSTPGPAGAYATADSVGVTVSAGSNPAVNNVVAAYNAGNPDENMPIVSLTRGPAVTKGGRTMLPVIGIDPRAANDAVTSAATAPDDGFFTPASYRGAFPPVSGTRYDNAPGGNWLIGWTAADAFGFVVQPTQTSVSDWTAFE